MRLVLRLGFLLAQLMQPGDRLSSRLVGVHVDIIVTHRVGRKESDDGARLQPSLIDQGLEHFLRVRIQIGRRFADYRIAQDVRKFPGEFPRIEKRHPIDIGHEFRQRIILERPHAQVVGDGRRVGRPVEFQFLEACLGQRQLR